MITGLVLFAVLLRHLDRDLREVLLHPVIQRPVTHLTAEFGGHRPIRLHPAIILAVPPGLDVSPEDIAYLARLEGQAMPRVGLRSRPAGFIGRAVGDRGFGIFAVVQPQSLQPVPAVHEDERPV